jgi:hypothetical protein
MRLLMALILGSGLCLSMAFAQSSQDTESNMSCVERLQMPVYPPLAAAARIRGSVIATAVISTGGSAQIAIAISPGAHSLLTPAVEKALRASQFRKSCAGKSVTLVFNFVLGEELDPDGLPQRVSYSYPNQFSISVPPRIAQP